MKKYFAWVFFIIGVSGLVRIGIHQAPIFGYENIPFMEYLEGFFGATFIMAIFFYLWWKWK